MRDLKIKDFKFTNPTEHTEIAGWFGSLHAPPGEMTNFFKKTKDKNWVIKNTKHINKLIFQDDRYINGTPEAIKIFKKIMKGVTFSLRYKNHHVTMHYKNPHVSSKEELIFNVKL